MGKKLKINFNSYLSGMIQQECYLVRWFIIRQNPLVLATSTPKTTEWSFGCKLSITLFFAWHLLQRPSYVMPFREQKKLLIFWTFSTFSTFTTFVLLIENLLEKNSLLYFNIAIIDLIFALGYRSINFFGLLEVYITWGFHLRGSVVINFQLTWTIINSGCL